ncbi:hypothetical protein M436DRAFT_67771 [Aureobasidium namibiae CBS 147.97]|uniref:Uncharacterized protein n=1 Tax=Aureobasidium namibiae CBS 147.97 TaxID=1043004 RepID=A0A074WB90_9PEZI|nr:uncharacterized protein M436DRAFT_67771 [Aureobasidium namibiae CBS 147.97]KEQ68854.1 hypothetical protein M436DRAFT_67771 [Aureobasidium namibiae CBS 147.97]
MASSPISTANDIEPASYCDAGLDETGGVGYGGDCKAVEQTPPPHILDVLEKDERSRITAKWCKQMEGIDDLSSSSSAFESVLPSHIKYSISDVNLSTEAGKLLLVYHAPTTLKSQTSASSNRLWTRNTTITMSDLTTTVGETPLASPAQTSQCALPAEPATVTARPDLTPLETSTVQERATPPVCTHCDLHLQFLHRTFSNPPTLTAIKDPSRWTILPSLNILTAHSTTGEEASCSTPSSSGPGIGGKSTTLSCVRVSETSIAKGAHAPSPTFLSSSPSAPPLSDDHTEQPFLTSRQKITDHYLVRPSTKRHLTDLRAQAILLHLRARPFHLQPESPSPSLPRGILTIRDYPKLWTLKQSTRSSSSLHPPDKVLVEPRNRRLPGEAFHESSEEAQHVEGTESSAAPKRRGRLRKQSHLTPVVVFGTEEDGAIASPTTKLLRSHSAQQEQHASNGSAHKPSRKNQFLDTSLRNTAVCQSILENTTTRRESNVLACTPHCLPEVSEAVLLVSQYTRRDKRQGEARGNEKRKSLPILL